jgi:hypothetical protein
MANIRIDFESQRLLDAGSDPEIVDEIHKGIEDLDAGQSVSHAKVAKCLASWGQPGETNPPP